MNERPDVDVMALIPARAGSARLPGKNRLMIGDRSLFDRAIDCAFEAESVGRVVVSTDDEALLRGCVNPRLRVLKRTEALAGGAVPMQPVILDALERAGPADVLVLLQPTSPLREPADVDACVELLLATRDCPSVMTVSETSHPIEWTFKMDNGTLDPLFGWAPIQQQSQNLPRRFQPNGAVYAVRSSHLLNGGPLAGAGTAAVVIPRERGIDIDTNLDYRVAVALHAQASTAGGR